MNQAGTPAFGCGGDLPTRADVVVVGAGITGAAVAHHLARRGVRVVVLEQAAQPGAGATGHSGGMVRGYDDDPAIAALALPSLAAYRDPGRWMSGRAPLHRAGSVTVADPAREPALQEAAGRINDALHTSAHVVRGAAETEGVRLAGGIALVEPEAGWVAPAEVTADWLRQAVADGAAVHCGVRVRAVEEDGGHPVVLTDAGVIRAGAVVLAVGPWAADPLPNLRPVTPVRTRSVQVSIVERHPATPPHATFIDLRTGLYAKPVGADRTLIGMPHLVWDCPVDSPPDPALARATVSALTTHFPWLATARCLTTIRAADAYASPETGGLLEDTGLPHVWAVRAWNGGGVKTAPEAGRRIADTVAADAASPAV
ncbi:NAD(P)/FAD-dependent oxidoreductase [Streptomyces sp. NPDC017095]|uniref:NAD(P)/FAD-dependent oxidoreductase n=1 Tax=Streptomyces sp. NPDC017095 TaxID=3364977 RepID=UPI0037BDFE72